MSIPQAAALYTQGFGTRPENVEIPHYDVRDPTSQDVNYPIGKRWVNTVANDEWTLTSLTTSNGLQTANWEVSAGGSLLISTVTTSDSTVVVPTAGNINLFGAGSITTVGSGSTATVELTGLTNHNVLVGAGTTTVTKVAPSATTGVALVSQGSSTDPHFGTVVVAGGGTGATTLTAHGVLVGEGTSPVVATAVGSNGQVLIGATGADPAFASITTSTLVLTSGANSLGIDVANGGFATSVSGGTTLVAQNSYVVQQAGAATFLLPATASPGQIFLVASAHSNTGGFVITQGAGQEIWSNTSHTTSGATGTLTGAVSTSAYLMCTVANVEFLVIGNTAGLVFA